MNLILLGPPGAGKGTQASMICSDFNLTHISTGDLLRNETKSTSDLGKEIKSIVDAGNLVSNEIILKILKNFISKNNDASGFLFDGFPRNAEQAGLLDQLMHEMNFKLNAVIMLDVDKELLLNRILKRKEDEGRADDNEKVLENRLRVYFEETQPLVEVYQNENLLIKIDGEGEISQVNQRINTSLGSL